MLILEVDRYSRLASSSVRTRIGAFCWRRNAPYALAAAPALRLQKNEVRNVGLFATIEDNGFRHLLEFFNYASFATIVTSIKNQ